MRLSNKQEGSEQTFRSSTKTIHQMWKEEERKREKLEITLTTLKKQDLEKGVGWVDRKGASEQKHAHDNVREKELQEGKYMGRKYRPPRVVCF